MLSPRFASWIRHLFRPAAPRRTLLALEQLEARNVPSVAPNGVFVSTLYQGLLGRDADANGLTYWTGQLNAGVSRTQVAVDIAGSNEALGHDVQLFYGTLLNRPADAAGLDYWTNQLASGTTLDQAKAGILGSNEFFTKAGGTNQDFLDALYSHELGRSVDSTGLNYWENQLNAGVSRTTVADEVLATPEAKNEKVTSFFKDLLDRTPDANGMNYWSAQLQSDVPETQVLGGILGSNEYFGHVQNTAATTTEVDPNQAASNMIGSLDLFTGPLPNAESLAYRRIAPPVAATPIPSAPAAAKPPAIFTETAPVVTTTPANTNQTAPPITPAPAPASPLAATTITAASGGDNTAPQLQDQQQAAEQQQEDDAAQQAAAQQQQTDDTTDQQDAQAVQDDPAALEDGTEPVDMNDYNTYWEAAESDIAPDPFTLDYNTYWAEVEAQQYYQENYDTSN